MTSITITGKAFDDEHGEHAFVRYANGDDFVSLATIGVEPCPDCDGKCGIEYVVLRITGHPDPDRDLEVGDKGGRRSASRRRSCRSPR